MRTCLAIVPAYNEEESVGGVIADLFEHAPNFDVVVVDDGSADRTEARARAAGALVIALPFNLGIGGAMQTGYRYALERGYEIAVQVDGDGQHDASEIPRLYEALTDDPGVNMVTGSRFLARDSDGYGSSAARRVGIRLFSFVLSRITGRRITDPTSGFRICDHKSISLFARDYPHDYPEVETTLMMHANALEAREIPVRMRKRMGGRSSIGFAHSALYMVKVLVAVFIGLLRARPALDHGERAVVEAQRSL